METLEEIAEKAKEFFKPIAEMVDRGEFKTYIIWDGTIELVLRFIHNGEFYSIICRFGRNTKELQFLYDGLLKNLGPYIKTFKTFKYKTDFDALINSDDKK